jgi:hypothetical protein
MLTDYTIRTGGTKRVEADKNGFRNPEPDPEIDVLEQHSTGNLVT